MAAQKSRNRRDVFGAGNAPEITTIAKATVVRIVDRQTNRSRANWSGITSS